MLLSVERPFAGAFEAGELAPEDPVEGSEASAGRLDRGKHAEHIEVLAHRDSPMEKLLLSHGLN
jgi:hypothetical protein